MNTVRHLCITALWTASLHTSNAQVVLASAGNFHGNANGSIAFTLGEPVIATQVLGSSIITQGFHQPPDDLITVAPAHAPIAGVTVSPNPTREDVFVTIPDAQSGWNCTLHDLCGKALMRQALMVRRTELDLSALANGSYVLHIADAQQRLVSTFQLILTK